MLPWPSVPAEDARAELEARAAEVEELRAEVADLQESLEEAEVRRWTGTGGAGDWWLGV